MILRVDGGASAHEIAALSAAIEALIAGEATVPSDPLPAVYHSRWRAAALGEHTLAFDDQVR